MIKIIKSGYTSQQAGRYQIRMQREIKTLRQVRSIPELASYFPAYHGEIMTGAGIGYVFDQVDHLVDIFKKQYRLSGDLYRELVAIIRLLIQHDVPFARILFAMFLLTNSRSDCTYSMVSVVSILSLLLCRLFLDA